MGISNYSTIGFNVTKAHKIVTPEEVGSYVLKGLLKVTSLFLGHNQVTKAVIAVPAKFNDQQRAATGLAYKLAGLKVVRVIEEPTAAAVAYQLHKKSNIHHILVYDFGGGTLDVSILYIAQGSVQVFATDGDETLGGSDLDVCLQEYILSKLPVESRSNAHIPTIRLLAEYAKKVLSFEDVAHMSVPQSDGNYSIEVTRNDFETTCSHIFDRSLIPVTRLLDELKMSPSDIDEVVLVGGTTRIPKIKKMLKSYFGKELNDHIDPDITVAYGAASILD
jgi:molecular chaperone DnaK (HSP70)